MFQLVKPTLNRLKHINLRTETHGKQKVSTVDLDFVLEDTNESLDLLHPALRTLFYYDPDADKGQETLETVPQVLKTQRFTQIKDIPWAEVRRGMDLTVIYGLGDEVSNFEFSEGVLTVKRIEFERNGLTKTFWRHSTSNVPDGAIDKLRTKQEQFVEVTLIQQEQLRTDAIDGSVGHPGASAAEANGQQRLDAEPDAGDAFAAAHDDAAAEERAQEARDTKGWPFGSGGAPDETEPAAEGPEPAQAAPKTGGRGAKSRRGAKAAAGAVS